MKLLSLTLALVAAVQSVSACGRIYGGMLNAIAGDSYTTTMFDGCTDRCQGTKNGFMWSSNTVVSMPCNSGYSLKMTGNGGKAYYSTPYSKFEINMGAQFDKIPCGQVRETPVYCTTFKYDCWTFQHDCKNNGCGGYKSGISKICSSWNDAKRGLPEKDPNPEWIYDKTIAMEMVKNGTLKLSGLALEVYNHEQRKGSRFQASSNYNITALQEKYFGYAI